MVKLLWMTIDRHPESLRNLIREQLAETGWEIHEVSYDQLDGLTAVPLELIDAVLLAPARHFPEKYMDRLHLCKLMQIWSSGYDKFNIEDARSRNIPVANNHGSNAISVAEHTLMMMLGVSRRAPEMHNRVITGNWAGNDHGMTSHSLAGKTLGIVGLGNIGTLVAKRAEAFGMRIIFSDPGVETALNHNWEKVKFDSLLRDSDYISFHVHLSPDTRGMINSTNLRQILKKPFLINVSRAEIIEKKALMQALGSETIRGIAIDAHYEEPTDPSDKLLSLSNVLFSPHVAGSTLDSYRSTISASLQNISLATSRETSGGNGVSFKGSL